MLVLIRGIGESIWIGKEVKITVLKIADGKITLGTTAPRHVTVDRKEIYRRKLRDRRSAIALEPDSAADDSVAETAPP